MLHRAEKLAGLKPELCDLVQRAAELCPFDIVVLEGMRTFARQQWLLRQGASRTLRSKHLTGDAVDLAPMLDVDDDGDQDVSWHWPHYHQLAHYVKQAAAEKGVEIEWGGDWVAFKDGPHWQLA